MAKPESLPTLVLPNGRQAVVPPPRTARTRDDRLAFWYRFQERLRLWHNAQRGRTADWLREMYDPRIKVVMVHRNNLMDQRVRHKPGNARRYLPNLEQLAFKVAAGRATNFDRYIDPMKLPVPDPAPPPIDPLEDWTGYAEVDTNNRYAVAANTITVTGLTRDEAAHVSLDRSSNPFAGDFNHLVECQITATAGNSLVFPYLLASAVDEFNGLDTANESALGSEAFKNSAMILVELVAGSLSSDTSVALAAVNWFLQTIRDEAVGANGTLTQAIRTGSHTGTLLDTTSITLAANLDLDFVFGADSVDSNHADRTVSALIKNLDLQEAVAETPEAHSWDAYYRNRGGQGR